MSTFASLDFSKDNDDDDADYSASSEDEEDKKKKIGFGGYAKSGKGKGKRKGSKRKRDETENRVGAAVLSEDEEDLFTALVLPSADKEPVSASLSTKVATKARPKKCPSKPKQKNQQQEKDLFGDDSDDEEDQRKDSPPALEHSSKDSGEGSKPAVASIEKPAPKAEEQSLASLMNSLNRKKKAQPPKKKKKKNWWDEDEDEAPKRVKYVEKNIFGEVEIGGGSSSQKGGESDFVVVEEVKSFAGKNVVFKQKVQKGSVNHKKFQKLEAKKKDSLERVLLELQSTKKLSTLDKSKVDWEKDKEVEGDAEQLAQFSKSEKSYTSQQQFLVDTDHRLFEKEKKVRERERAKRDREQGPRPVS